MASVTPFGQTGPWKDYQSTDLIALAASGFMQITGEPGGPPMRQGNEQSHFPRRPIRRGSHPRRPLPPRLWRRAGDSTSMFPCRKP